VDKAASFAVDATAHRSTLSLAAMKLASLFLVVGLLGGATANAGTSLVFGRAISEDDDVEIKPTPEEVCPPDAFCLFGWSRWTLNIDRSFAGPNVKGRIHAVHMQHTTHNRTFFNRLHVFALEYIDDSAERMRLHADYKLLDLIDEKAMFCTNTDPKRAGIPPEDIYAATTDDTYKFCFVDPNRKEP
jgi:hypothetical protein